MRLPIERTVERLAWPEPSFFSEALSAGPTRAEHDRLAAVAALNAVELRPEPARAIAPPESVRVAAWNLERGKYLEDAASALRTAGADICLLSEMDVGMARSGNRHSARELADALGMAYAYGTEFIELGLGDNREAFWHAGETNAAGLHGNAVLSKLPIEKAVIIPLDPGGGWFVDGGQPDQRRVGGRMALACRITLAAGPAWFVAVHFESRLGPPQRAEEMRILVTDMDRMAGSRPVLMGGDFNTGALPLLGRLPAAIFEKPEVYEPAFAVAGNAGFDWRNVNTPDATERQRPDGEPLPPFTRIDWFFARHMKASACRTLPAVNRFGTSISDHDWLTVDIAPA